MKAATAIKKIQDKFNITWIKDGKEWDNNPNTILWSGEGADINVDGHTVRAFNAYSESDSYIFGVHKALYDFCKSLGIHWEAYDSGTYLAYKN